MISELENVQHTSRVSNIIHGTAWKEKTKMYNNKICIPYLLYQDDFEVDNTLGSKAGTDKISAVYLSFALLSDSKISQVENILPCCYTKSSDSSHGNQSKFMPLIHILKDLEETGVNVSTKNSKIQVHLLLASVIGDNLGLNSILGFAK